MFLFILIPFIFKLNIHWLDIFLFPDWLLKPGKLLIYIIYYSIIVWTILILENKTSLNNLFFHTWEKKNKSKKDIWLYIGTFILLFLSLGLFSINTSNLSFEDDEYYTVSVANNLYKTWELYQWDWIEDIPWQVSERCAEKQYCKYTRSYIYTHIVELSYRIFGVSEFSTRLPGILLYFATFILVFVFMKIMKFKSSFIFLTLLLFVGSKVIFANFFIARMYSLLIFSTLLIYILIVLIHRYVYNKYISRVLTLVFLTPLVLFLGYNSHISFMLLVWMLFLFSLLLLKKEILYYSGKIKDYNEQLRTFILVIMWVILLLICFQLDIFGKFERFFTLRFEAWYYGRYFQYILTSSIWLLGASYYIVIIFFLWVIAFFKFLYSPKNIFFTLPYFITGSFVVMHLYFLDTIYFIADRYVSHINLLAIIAISMTIFILIASFKTSAKRYAVIVIGVICVLWITNLVSDEYNKKNIFADYNKWYERFLNDFDKQTDVMIGIPIRDYYIKWVWDVVKINASQRFNNYDFEAFTTDLEKYKDKNIYFIYSDVKSFHVHGSIKKYLRNNVPVYSHEWNVTIYFLPATIQ